MSLPSSLASLLTSHLQGLEETGRDRLRLDGPLPRLAPSAAPASPPPPKPRQTVASPKIVPPSPDPEILPGPKVAPVTPEPAEAALSVRVLQRMPECEDTLDPASTRIVLVTGTHEMEEKNGTLLQDMLKAIGYAPEGETRTYREGENLSGLGARVLVMGNDALRKVSTAGMDLGIVRGMWQQSPHGKLLSTYAPSYLHDNPPGKKAAWSDLQRVLKELSLDVPPWTRQRLKKK